MSTIHPTMQTAPKFAAKRSLRNWLVQMGLYFVRSKPVLPLISLYVSSQIYRYREKRSNSPTVVRLLALNDNRYHADLDGLLAHPEVEIFILPTRVQELINAIWYSELKHFDRTDMIHWIDTFTENTVPLIRSCRGNLTKFLVEILPRLQKKHAFQAITTCSCFYIQDRDWVQASKKLGIPFYVIQKENLKDPIAHAKEIQRYIDRKRKFNGNRVFMFSGLERAVMLGSGACHDDQMSIVGGLRTDAVYRSVQEGKIKPPDPKTITLFSFMHCSGGLWLRDADFFSKDRTEGFIELFDLVHAKIIEFAQRRPDINVFIKLKFESPRWRQEIADAVQRKLQVDIATIPNIKIISDIPAHDLIERSAVTIGFNSTTLLESKLFGRRTIVPSFAEATGKYAETNVMFKGYLEKVFAVATDPETFGDKIEKELAGENPNKEMTKEFIRDYLGYFDGGAARRVVEIIKSDIF